MAGMSNYAEAQSLLDALSQVMADLDEAEARCRNLVRAARELPDPVAWSQIGERLRMTKQGAQKRYGPKPPRPLGDLFDHPDQLLLPDVI